MNTTDVPAAVAGLIQQIAPEVDLSAIDPDADLRRAADLDSLDFQTLVELVAAETGVEIPEADYAQARSLSGLIDYVTTRIP